VDLCCGLLKLPPLKDGEGPRIGLGSGFLHRLNVGDPVELRVIHAPNFHLPLSNRVPVLCVAAGVGIAPIRAFVQERASRVKEAGGSSAGMAPFALILGFRSPAEVLFSAEIADASASGALSAVLYAFSRVPGQPKQYTSDVICSPEGRAVVATTLQAHPAAALYVCGSAHMAIGLKGALEGVMGVDAVAAMKASGRYREEVFSAGDQVHLRSR
jgi:sulfite reductase alpha subunit-like flavoprotein